MTTPPWLKNHLKKHPPAPRGVLASGKAAPLPTDGSQAAEKQRSRKKRARQISEQRGTRDGMLSLEVAVEDEPSHSMKMKYEEFARMYLVDFSQTRAAVRMGYSRTSAANLGNDMFWQPYTQAYLVKLIREIEEHTIVGRNEVLAGLLREAHNLGADANSSSRIKAWSEIGKILGMYVQRVELSANSSGVMEVPMVADSNQWEQFAQASQTKLMEVVRQ
jgi:predicted DNA-binding protein (UPF0251 family)